MRAAGLILLLASMALLSPRAAIAQPSPAAPAQLDTGAHVFLPPPLQWDHAMTADQPALRQGPSDFANRTGGFRFGMTVSQVNALLPDPIPGLSSSTLPLAYEYPGEVKYLGLPYAASGPLRLADDACVGAGSYIALLFNDLGLFRLSFRLIPDKVCPDTSPAARALFARFVPLGPEVALSVHYRSGRTEVVDITDPSASFLIPIRWHQGGS